MPLTKKDLSQIKEVVRAETDKAVEGLAVIVNKGFQAVDKRFEQVDKRFEQVDKRFEQIDTQLHRIDMRLDTVEHDISEIRKHFVYRDEFEHVIARLSAVEKKVGIHARK